MRFIGTTPLNIVLSMVGTVLSALCGSASARAPAEVPTPQPATATAAETQPAGPVAESIWPGIVRWYPSAAAKAAAPLSLIVQIPSHRYGPAPDGQRVKPVYGEADGRITAHIDIEPGTSLYGAGVVDGPLTLNGRKFIASPADRDLEPPATNAASLAMPWVVALRPDGTAFSVMADTTWRVEIDLTDGITMRAEGPALPIIIVDGEAPLAPTTAVSQIAGWQELPPRWAFGPQIGPVFVGLGGVDPSGVAKPWREHTMPADGLWLYAGSFVPIGEPVAGDGPGEQAVTSLRDAYWHVGLTLDPALSASPQTRALADEGAAAGHWVREADGGVYQHLYGMMETLLFPDLTRDTTRQWWAGLYRRTMSGRFDALGHMHTPYSNFPEAPFHRIRDDVRHEADADLGGPATHVALGAVYWSLLARVAKESLTSSPPDERPFVITATPSLISQRYGHTFIHPPNLNAGVAGALPMILNASLSGQVMIGVDIPGGTGDGSDLARNIAVGSMLPLIRLDMSAHGVTEPWAFSPQVEKTCREALERRSRLIPYLYTAALDAYRYGLPMVRPVFAADAANPKLRDVSDAFILGNDVLVRLTWPLGEPGPETALPGWRRFSFGETSAMLPELSLRPGAILPVGPVMQHDGEKPLEPLTLIVNAGADGTAHGTLYEDDGDGYAYQQNQCRMAYYTAETVDGELKLKMMRLDGGMGMAKRKLLVRVLLDEGKEATAEWWDGLEVKIRLP